MGEKNVQSWIDFAEEDLATAEWCIQGGRCIWAMAMCQQAIEKVIKALYVKQTGDIPERTHNLIKLAKDTGIFEELSQETKSLFDDLLIYYFSSRYPDKRKESILASAKAEANATFNKTKEVYLWVKDKL